MQGGATFSILPTAGGGARTNATPFVPPAAMFVPGQPSEPAANGPAESTASVSSPLPSAVLHSSASSGPEPSAAEHSQLPPAVDTPTSADAALEDGGAHGDALTAQAAVEEVPPHNTAQEQIQEQMQDVDQPVAEAWSAEDQQWHTYFSELQQWGAYYRASEGYSEEQVAQFYEASGGGYSETQILEYVRFYEAKRATAAVRAPAVEAAGGATVMEEAPAAVEAAGEGVEDGGSGVDAGLHVSTSGVVQQAGVAVGALATVLSTVQEGMHSGHVVAGALEHRHHLVGHGVISQSVMRIDFVMPRVMHVNLAYVSCMPPQPRAL